MKRQKHSDDGDGNQHVFDEALLHSFAFRIDNKTSTASPDFDDARAARAYMIACKAFSTYRNRFSVPLVVTSSVVTLRSSAFECSGVSLQYDGIGDARCF